MKTDPKPEEIEDPDRSEEKSEEQHNTTEEELAEEISSGWLL